MNHLRGKFIVLDGGEGCGKTTQADLLRAKLEAGGVPTLRVRDPGSTDMGERIRALLLDPANTGISMRCEMLLFMAARAQMMREMILPALDAKKCVVSERFISSTLAYQLGGDGLTAAEIRQVGQAAIAGRWPDLTILLDMPVDKGTARIMGPSKKNETAINSLFADRIEERSTEYHERVRQNFLAQAKDDPQHVRIVDAHHKPETVHKEILKLLETLK